MTLNEMEAYVREHLSQARAEHSVNVAAEAVKLARHYGADAEKAEIAGMLHDITKETSVPEQLQILKESGIITNSLDFCSPKLLHAQTAAALIPSLFGVNDPEILRAVRYHTTAREDMTLLEKVLYIADYISAERDYEGVEELRKTAYLDLEQAILIGLQFTVQELAENFRPIHPDTMAAYNQILCERMERRK